MWHFIKSTCIFRLYFSGFWFRMAARQICTLRKFVLVIIRNLFLCVFLNNQIEYHGTHKHQASQNVATLRDSRSHVSRRRNVSRTIITWMIAICIWLIKKLLHLVNVVSCLEFVQNEDSCFLTAAILNYSRIFLFF